MTIICIAALVIVAVLALIGLAVITGALIMFEAPFWYRGM